MRRSSIPEATSIGTDCDQYKPHYQSLMAFKDYKNQYLNTDSVGNYMSSTLASDLNNTTPNRTPAQMQQAVQENLSNLQNLETLVYGMTRCIQKDILQRSERVGDIYKLQSKLNTEEAAANDMELIAKTAKERASRLDHPYSQITRHETWFPLGRPLREGSVPVLLSISILFLILSLGMFLRMISTDFRFESDILTRLFPSYFQTKFIQ